jgi:DNA repair exonuclease SbcCD ATPase subunit/DNA repair exonuclease SbcCD nuclease subunit
MKVLSQSQHNKVTHIIHIADIHVRTGDRTHSRSEEYAAVFNRFISEISGLQCVLDECALVTVGGDIFHNKGRFETEGAVVLFEFINKLLCMCPVLIIAGNHDFRQEDPMYVDTVDMLVRPYIHTKSKFPIHYLKYTDHYVWENIGIGMCSVKDTLRSFNTAGIVDKLPLFPDPNAFDALKLYRVAMFHGSISQSALPSGRAVDSIAHGYPLEWMKGYNVALLGDNHKQQLHCGLSGTLHWTYPGSLIQQDDGEPTFGHGYVLWDVSANTGTLHHVPNDSGSITIIRKSSSAYVRLSPTEVIPLVDAVRIPHFPKKPKVRLVACDTYEDAIVEELAALGISPCAVKNTKTLNTGLWNNHENDNDNDDMNNDCVETLISMSDVNSPNQWDNYVKKSCPTLDVSDWIHDPKKLLIDVNGSSLPQSIIDKIHVRNSKIQKELDNYDGAMQSRDENKYSIKLKYMEWSYLMCFGAENRIDFESLEGKIVLLNGRNASGKSSFLDILCIGLYGVPTSSRGELNGDAKMTAHIIHDDKPAMASSNVILVFTVNGVKYMIKRCISEVHDKSRSHSESIVQVDDVSRTSHVVAEGSQMVTEWILRRFGTLQDMMMSSIVCQMDNTSFFYLSSSSQKDILDKSMNLQTISAYQGLLDETIKAYKYIANDLNTYVDGMSARNNVNAAADVTEMKEQLDGIRNDVNNYTECCDRLAVVVNDYAMKIGNIESAIVINDISHEQLLKDLDTLGKEFAEQNFVHMDDVSSVKTQLLIVQSRLQSQYDALLAVKEDDDDDVYRTEKQWDTLIDSSQRLLDAHNAVMPPELHGVDINWDNDHYTSIDPETAIKELDEVTESIFEVEVNLKEIMSNPVEKPFTVDSGGDVCDIPDDEFDLAQLRSLATSAYNSYIYLKSNEPVQVRARSVLESIIDSYKSKQVISKDCLDDEMTKLEDLKETYNKLTYNAVVKPLGIENRIDDDDDTSSYTLDDILAQQAELVKNVVVPMRPESGYANWLVKLNRWKELHGEDEHDDGNERMKDVESLQELLDKRQNLIKYKDALNLKQQESHRMQIEISAHLVDISRMETVQRVPYNKSCEACKSHHAMMDECIRNVNCALNAMRKTHVSCEKKIQKMQKTLDESVTLEEIDAMIEARRNYDIDEVEAWNLAKSQWDAERKRCEKLNKLGWMAYNMWSYELQCMAKEITAQQEKVDEMKKVALEMCALREKADEAEYELTQCIVREQWDANFRMWHGLYEKYTLALWKAWDEEKTACNVLLQGLRDRSEVLIKLIENAHVSETVREWVARKKVLEYTLNKHKWNRDMQEVTASISENDNSLTQCDLYIHYTKSMETLQKQIMMWEMRQADIELKKYRNLLQDSRDKYNKLSHELETVIRHSSASKEYTAFARFLQNKYDKLIKFRDIFIGAKGTSDGFKTSVYRDRVIPMIEKEVNAFLEELDNFRFKVNIVNTKMVYMVLDRGNTVQLGHCSGYQKFIIGLAMRAALCKIGAAGQSLKHIIIDEGFGCCDAVNIQRAQHVVQELVRTGKYTSIILMSHLEAVREISNTTVNIVRDESKFSYIVYGGKSDVVKYTRDRDTQVSEGVKPKGRPKGAKKLLKT